MGVRSARVVVRAKGAVHAKDADVSEYSISIPDHRNGNKGSYVYDCVVYGRPIPIHLFE